jgi:ABC-type Fe3+ transport system permease subunit
VHAIALPLYIMLAKVGLTNTYAALIVPWSISVFGIFLMRQFFMTVPDDLIDAARMDGMSEFSIVWQVMLPTAIPALLAFGIFSVVAHWNDYYWPRVVITGNKDLMTPPLGLRMFKSDMDGNEYGPMMAATTVIVLPLVIVFLLARIKGHARIASREVWHITFAEQLFHLLKRCQAGFTVKIDFAIFQDGLALTPHQRLEEPVARDAPAPPHRCFMTRFHQCMARGNDLIPSGRKLCNANCIEVIHIVIPNRQ